MNGVTPSLDLPALLSSNLPLLQIRKLPQMMNRVQVSDLDKPGSDTFHYLASGLETPTPVALPFEQIARVERVRA